MGVPGWRNAIHAGCQIGFLAFAGSALGSLCDSGSHFQAKNTLTRHSAAAIIPGAACPKCAANDPIAGPTMTPAEVAAESQPSARARSAGSTVSATYAWATPVVPPPAPCTTRERKSSHTLVGQAEHDR